MKALIIVTLVALVVISISYHWNSITKLYFSFTQNIESNKYEFTQNIHTEQQTITIYNQRTHDGDDKLVQALIGSDASTIENLLAYETGEFIRLVKSLRPQKIYNIRDIARLNCVSSPVCQKKISQGERELMQCADTMLTLYNKELKQYPNCKQAIEEFYTVTFLCSLYQKQLVCVEDDPMESTEDRTKRVTARSQNSYDCLARHLDNVNAKNKCLIDTPKTTQAQFDAELKKYCRQAVACRTFSKEADCISKYQKLFAGDKSLIGKDCTNSHLTAMKQELEIVNLLINKKFGKNAFNEPYDTCTFVRHYENTIHIEQIFAKVKTIQDYNKVMMAELQKNGKNATIPWAMLPIYFPPNTMEYQKMLTESSLSYNYYGACMISHLKPQ